MRYYLILNWYLMLPLIENDLQGYSSFKCNPRCMFGNDRRVRLIACLISAKHSVMLLSRLYIPWTMSSDLGYFSLWLERHECQWMDFQSCMEAMVLSFSPLRNGVLLSSYPELTPGKHVLKCIPIWVTGICAMLFVTSLFEKWVFLYTYVSQKLLHERQRGLEDPY